MGLKGSKMAFLAHLLPWQRWLKGWVQLALFAGAFPYGLGVLTEWQLRVVRCLKWEPEAPRASILASKVKGTGHHFTRIYQSEQSQACPDSRAGNDDGKAD